MTDQNASWTWLGFSPATGKLTVEGDPHSVLGLSADQLSRSEDPLGMLPGSVAASLMEDRGIIRDTDLSIVILPGNARQFNTVTVIREKSPEYDLVSDVAAGVAAFSPDGTILCWNRRMSVLFGPRESDVKGRKASDILPSPVLYNWASIISSAHMGHEVRIDFRPSGDRKLEGVLSRGGPGVIGLFLDSTENYSTAKRLRALNRLNQAYIQSTETGLILLDSRLRILLSNGAFSRISGERGLLTGMQLHDVLPEGSYRWVHDASEKLLGEDRSEFSATVPFQRDDTGSLVVRHTLRAVRNEMNQAVNFVCLFQDKTQLTRLKSDVDDLRKSISGLAELSRQMVETETGETGDICERVMEITGSSAVNLYTYDPSETLRLSGSSGRWPQGAGREEPGRLGFPAYVWRGEKVCIIEAQETGELSPFFTRCVVLPLGKGVSNAGFLVVCDPSESGANPAVLDSVASLARLYLGPVSGVSGRKARDRSTAREDSGMVPVLASFPFPAAMFQKNGLPEDWNPAMEKLTGISAGDCTRQDLENMIDPDGKGFTLDSLASVGPPDFEENALVWRARKRDGSLTEPYKWNVSIMEHPRTFQGDYGFLLTAIPVSAVFRFKGGADRVSAEMIKVLRMFEETISRRDEENTLRAVSDLCLAYSPSGGLGFCREGELFTSFHKDHPGNTKAEWITGPSLLLDGVEYEVRITGGVDIPLLETVCEIVSCLRGKLREPCPDTEFSSDYINNSVKKLVLYMEKYCDYSVRQSEAVLHLVDKTDPFSGLARTMLFSGETAAKAAGLLRLALSVSSSGFRRVSLERFLSGLHASFTGMGLRPPSLSIAEGLPEVVIIPEVVLQCISSLCRIRFPEELMSFSASLEEYEGDPVVRLAATVPARALAPSEVSEGLDNLEQGVFDDLAEAAVISGILAQAGCRMEPGGGGELTILFRTHGPGIA